MITGKQFLKGLLLFVILPAALGVAVAWGSEQSLFKSETSPTPTSQASAAPVGSPTALPQTNRNLPDTKASVKPGKQYEVQPGDTVSSIAQANGIDWLELAKYNGIPYPYNLTVGQVISIPGPQ